MLERLAAWVLNNYLGQYVENLNTDQLSIGLLKGEVELESLPLKKDALNSLDLSIEVRAGFLGKIRLKIPVTRLRTDPWEIFIEKLYLVAGPVLPAGFDEEKEEQANQCRKLAKLDLMEAKWRSEHEAKQEVSYYASSYSSWVSYGTSLASNIIENLQLKIRDVHIRYEDNLSNPECPFAWGLAIGSLIAQNTNEKLIFQGGLHDINDARQKQMDLTNLSWYWDLNATMIGTLPMAELQDAMQEMMNKSDLRQYILEPVSAKAKLVRNPSPSSLRSRSSPRVICDLQLETFPISLTEAQYDSMIKWVYEFERMEKIYRYRKWHPQVEVHGHAREWWEFAVKPYLYEIRQKHEKQKWSYVLQRAKDNVLYVKAYIEHLKNPVTCPVNLKNHKDDIEQELVYEDLKILRELAMAKVSAAAEEELRSRKQQSCTSGAGILQRWFPLWSGWYSSAAPSNTDASTGSESDTHDKHLEETDSSQHLEEEILDALATSDENDTLFRRDVVFAKLSFLLKHSSFAISRCNKNNSQVAPTANGRKPLFELEFEDVVIILEMRPRLNSTMFVAKLGALYLRDKVMDRSLFPLIIAPQNRESSGPTANISITSAITNKFKMLSSWGSAASMKRENEDPLFEFSYETRPLDSTADVRLLIKSQALDVVYNSEAFNSIIEFFTKPHQSYRNQAKYELASAARSQYEKLKQQTKDEIFRNYGQFFSEVQSLKQQRHHWIIHLDVSAPRIIFPDNFYNDNTTIVVCDFGRLQFRNYSSDVNEKSYFNASLSDDEDDFRTPCSTPPDSSESNSESKQSFHPTLSSIQEGVSQSDVTEVSLHKQIYDRYSLDFLDLQILVCEAKNSLKYAYVQGTSTMHVLDRFSISLLLERRTVYTNDPQWPSITLSGSLPQLVVHVNEQKIHALKNCFGRYSFSQWMSSTSSSVEPKSSIDQTVSNKWTQKLHQGVHLKALNTHESPLETTIKEEDAKTRILALMQFSIGRMCLDVQSRGRSIAELQVSGIKSNFTKRPYDTSVSLTVHSLLLVDALQTFGPDFELLIASHKNISMDSVSGSIRDSEPNSPTSPASPTSSHTALTSPSVINAALKRLQTKDSTVLKRAVSPVSPTSPSNLETSFNLHSSCLSGKHLDAEALITIEFETIMPELHGSLDCTTNIVTVQFNALDIIANQETMVEILGFIMQVMPVGSCNIDSHCSKSSQDSDLNSDTNQEMPKMMASMINESSAHMEVTFDFNRLSVLFLKSVNVEGVLTAQKVATATMTGACIQAKFDSVIKVEGSLGGMQILDLVPEGAVHSRILSVGCDPFADCHTALIDQLQADLYKTSLETSSIVNSYNDRQAFTFSFNLLKKSEDLDSSTSQAFTITEAVIELRIASVFYIHSLRFIRDLASCASEFKQYTAKLMGSLKMAAVEVADRLAEGIFPGGKKGRGVLHPPSPLAEIPPLHESVNESSDMDIKLDVLLETPVIIIPESPSSSNVLVAHLGQITMKNGKRNSNEYTSFSHGKLLSVEHNKSQRITIEVRDMNLHSLNIEHNLPASLQKQWKIMAKPQDVYTCMEKGIPILHDTLIKLVIDHSVGKYVLQTADEFPFVADNYQVHFAVDSPTTHICELYNVHGEVVTPLKVSLSKEQYNQILRTLASLTVENDHNVQYDQLSSKSRDCETPVSSEQVTANKSISKFNSDNVGFEIKIFFELSEFTVELFGDLADMKRGLISLSFKDILFNFETQDVHVSSTEVTLKSLVMEDLLQDPGSKHRFLMLSSFTDHENDSYKKPAKSEYLSASCPDVSIPAVILASQYSLPDKLNTENIFHNFHRIKEKKMYGGYLHKQPPPFSLLKSDCHCPRTPPPSPFGTGERDDTSAVDALVHIKILFVNSSCTEFHTTYNSVNRLVDINFNSLDTIISLQSWVVVFDFFEIGEANSIATLTSDSRHGSTAVYEVNRSGKLIGGKYEDQTNTEMEIQVKSLSVILVMNDSELAKANISNFKARVLNKKGDLSIHGKLGNMSLLDLSAQGHLYRERFLTVGNGALDFQIVKLGTVHLSQTKPYDTKVTLNMSSVRYIHTHRFWTEISAFFQHFSQLRAIMTRLRATAAGIEMPMNQRGSRVLLNIHVNSPIIIIPVSSWSTKVLVADLGQLNITNEFLPSGAQGTKSVVSHQLYNSTEFEVPLMAESSKPYATSESHCDHLNDEAATLHSFDKTTSCESCLLEVTYVHLLDIDLYSAERQERVKEVNYHLMPSVLEFPMHIIKKQGNALLTEKCKLDLQMERNMDKEWNHSVADLDIYGKLSAVHGLIDVNQYMIIRGILEYNLGEQFDTSGLHYEVQDEKGGYKKIWTQLSFRLDLVNVLVEFLSDSSLAKVNFIKSRLTYERVSNNSRDIDLVSQEILISDTRYCDYPANAKPNVFCTILQPTKNSKTNFLQAELHYRSSQDTSRLTVLLNNMQLIAVFDWWAAVIDFIGKRIHNPNSCNSTLVSAAAFKSVHSSSKYAITVSAGVATKTGKVPTNGDLPLEIKINITETSIVVVEDSSVWDTSAIILKSTTVLSCRPSAQNKPLSCSLQSLEVFSCILGLEEDTALSIIDPVTVSIDVVALNNGANGGLLELTAIGMYHTLEIAVQDLSVRLSYHDMQMFLHILDALPFQVQNTSLECYAANMVSAPEDQHLEIDVHKLQDLGFCRKNCLKALKACKGNLNEAALWLTQNSAPVSIIESHTSSDSAGSSKWFIIKEVEIQATSICVCIIDDCKDADVPLVEATFSDLNLSQTVTNWTNGKAEFTLLVDFYNRKLSGWEPLLEPWKGLIEWQNCLMSSGSGHRLRINIKGDDILNLNVTSSLIHVYQTVKNNWTEDYYASGRSERVVECDKPDVGWNLHGYKRRSPFVPFALKNSTGCELKFCTTTVTSDQLINMNYDGGGISPSLKDTNWFMVKPGDVVPFKFDGRVKMRHQDTHELKIHQLTVVIDGWQPVAPVSVDKVGVFFRHTKPCVNQSSSSHFGRLPVKVVFSVTLEGSARKLVTVRSALVLANRLDSVMEIRLENNAMHLGAASLVHLAPGRIYPVAIPYVMSTISARPAGASGRLAYSNPIQWHQVTKLDEIQEMQYVCSLLIHHNSGNYNFCARIHRENYPPGETSPNVKGLPLNPLIQPSHTITFVAPISLVNLLPYELLYEVSSPKCLQGHIKPGTKASLHSLNLSSGLEIQLQFESFNVINNLIIPSSSSPFEAFLHALDRCGRTLLLQAKAVGVQGGCSLEVFIFAPYWFVNKTGLPLIFRQENVQVEAAGQFSEHEMARSVSPLLFSFSDREAPAWCSMRVGKSVHPDGEPKWCQYFHLQPGIQFRRLRVLSCDSRPDWVYSIGIEVQCGREKYGDVHFVTFTPRFQLNNHSTYRLEFTQKYAIEKGSVLDEVRLSALPKCQLQFHWPRIDLEQLLCVRISDLENCSWSGGFPIEKNDSFQINVRDGNCKPVFLRVEVILEGPTVYVIFTNAENMPPPFRIDNMSEVPITFHQTSIPEERMRICVRPHSSVPYALDEPTLQPQVTCLAPGGSSASYYLTIFGESKHQLSYENFIYITFTDTFPKRESSSTAAVCSAQSDSYCYRELVLEVPEGGLKIILSPKEKGKRTQLWRMTSTGMLQHEGSSPPRHLKSTDNRLVLDIADIAPHPDKYVALRLRKPDPRRSITQTWEFTDDGRLCCKLRNLYVQSRDGFQGLKAGSEAVLGPSQPVIYNTNENGIPVEQSISRQRLWPGSGLLGVKVIHDGPTRVLQVIDIRQKSLILHHHVQSDWTFVEEGMGSNYCDEKKIDFAASMFQHVQVKLSLSQGIGVSLINSLPEELIYAQFMNITFEYTKSPSEQMIDGSVQNIQVDNQLQDAECPVFLYVTPMSKHDYQRHLPAIHFQVIKAESSHTNVEIYKMLTMAVKNLTLQVEERLLLKFLDFISYGKNEEHVSGMESNKFSQAASTALAKRYYFDTLKLALEQVRLSVITSSKLSPELKAVKKEAGLRLIQFEDALVELDSYLRTHSFETKQILVASVIDHYKSELKSQAAKILGAVDFLGNPLGLMNDVSEGLSGFFNEGNVGGLLKNVTHGLSNSAVKVTETLSEGLGVVTMDDKHQEKRKKIRAEHRGGSGEQLVAGFKGFGFGLYSGVTSIVTQTYEGATSEGIPGFFSGLGKGLLGTITKPAVGVLDLATSAASAVRETSRSTYHMSPSRLRLRRLCIDPRGLLPRYSAEHSRAQELLYSLNKNHKELFIALEVLSYSQDGLCALVSSSNVYFLSRESNAPTTQCVLSITFSDLYHCKMVRDIVGSKIYYYLELTTRAHNASGITTANENHCKKPKVLCDSELIAQKVSQKINYAKSLHEEMVHTLLPSKYNTEETF